MYPKKQLAQLVVKACEFYGVDKVVISPGSRNAPLTIGFSNHPSIESFSVVDERCAAFFALGMAQQSQKPVVLVCTSGSALLNYYPAIAEAFYSRVPLIVISADRPKHLIDIGDGQTIRQENVFENHIAYSANLIEDDNLVSQNLKEVSKAIQTSINEKLPVHINVPFNEPLYELVSRIEEFNFVRNETFTNKSITITEEIKSFWNSSKRKLLLVGVNFPSEDLQNIVDVFIDDESVLVFTESTSNLSHPKIVNSIDKLISKLTDQEFQDLQPDILVTIGGFIVSKRIKQFLRKYKPRHHWHVDEFTKLDTYFSLSKHIKTKPLVFFSSLQNKVCYVSSDYQKRWVKEMESRQVRHRKFIKTALYSDIKVVGEVLKSIPDHVQLQVSNSSIIRYVQLFDVSKTVQVFCNRGTSGIDGSTSTAIGASTVSLKQTVFLTGDISFFYDSNALWNSYIPDDFRIILVNNDGGGIFKIIPGPKSSTALPYFETKHGLTAVHLASMFGFEYYSVTNEIELQTCFDDFYTKSEKPKILEIFTPSQTNDVVLQDYFNYL